MLEMNLFDTADLLTSCCDPLLYLALKSARLQGVRVVAHGVLAAIQKSLGSSAGVLSRDITLISGSI